MIGKKKEQDIIEAAKAVLRVEEFDTEQQRHLIALHRIYDRWKGPERVDGEKYLQAVMAFLKTARHLLKLNKISMRNPSLPLIDERLVERVIESIHPLFRWRAEALNSGRFTLQRKRGKRPNDRVALYLSGMTTWYGYYFGTPKSGTNSIFTNLIHECLSILDLKYLVNPPHKAIKDAVQGWHETQEDHKRYKKEKRKGLYLVK